VLCGGRLFDCCVCVRVFVFCCACYVWFVTRSGNRRVVRFCCGCDQIISINIYMF
jgi:hypothetical protein